MLCSTIKRSTPHCQRLLSASILTKCKNTVPHTIHQQAYLRRSLKQIRFFSTTMPEDTLFAKIVRGDVPSTKVYEDDKCYAFRDINPAAPIHILLIPKIAGRLSRLSNAEDDDKEILGHLMWAVSHIAKQEKIGDFRVVINDGPSACQSVFHLHLHILGGRSLSWPPGALTLFDSGFPTGSFARSNGYEAARQLGYVTDRSSLVKFIRHGLDNTSSQHLPIITSLYQIIKKGFATITDLRPIKRNATELLDQVTFTSGELTSIRALPNILKTAPVQNISNYAGLKSLQGEAQWAQVPDISGNCYSSGHNMLGNGADRMDMKNTQTGIALQVVQVAKIADHVLDLNEWLDAVLICNQPEYNASQSQGKSLMRTLEQMDEKLEQGPLTLRNLSRAILRIWIKVLERQENTEESETAFEKNNIEQDVNQAMDRDWLTELLKPEQVLKYLRSRICPDVCPHFTVVTALSCLSFGMSHQECCLAFLFNYVRSTVSAAVRDGLIGPQDAQRLISEVLGLWEVHEVSGNQKLLEKLVKSYGPPELQNNTIHPDLRLTCPLIDVIQAAHPLLFSKLFLS